MNAASSQTATRTKPLLNERERQVLQLRYIDELTLAETGERLGITRERVRQIEAKAFCRVRACASIRQRALELLR